MLTPVIGIFVLLGVVFTALSERSESSLSFLDPHAAIVVFGGVLGALLIAIDRRSLGRMFISLRQLLPSASEFTREINGTKAGLKTIRQAWRENRRGEILKLADSAPTKELQVAADALIQQLPVAAIAEKFLELKTYYSSNASPVIEGWEMVGKLAPSFGMVGTVTGMVQMFQHMADNSGNLGGAMAMALVATLYGITFGAAVGGPMASRINNQLNERLDLLEFMQQTVTALVDENRPARTRDS
jgi:chemotaxis protein MotA